MNLPDWKGLFLYEFSLSEVTNVRWTNEIANLHMYCSVWKCQIFIWSSRAFPWLEVPSFKWISPFESTQFHINIWNSLFGRAKFIEFDAMVYKSSVLPLRVFVDSLIQGAIFKQGAKIMQPLEDAGVYIYIYIYICINQLYVIIYIYIYT